MEAGQRIRDYMLEEQIEADCGGEVWRARHQYQEAYFAMWLLDPGVPK